ncbi:hypothetical protein MYX82_08695 [Acidobacteria bacterium AH-259-D05]|nr:hypothetical protein [Acidobacteria bacterium AH-259-D05]
MIADELFLAAWKSGVEMTVDGSVVHLKASSKPPEELLKKLQEHKSALLRFLSCWIDTPYGDAKFWGFLGEDRCGVVLRNQPDRVAWMKKSELTIKPDREAMSTTVH